MGDSVRVNGGGVCGGVFDVVVSVLTGDPSQ